MSSKQWRCLASALAIGLIATFTLPALAQNAEVKEKPRMYTYVALWTLPRSQWAEWDKTQAADQKTLQAALASGAIIGYGDDANLVHMPDQPTHDDWFQSMSMAGLINTLEQFYKSGTTTSPVLESATKHWDEILVSRYYNWHSGSWQGTYSRGSSYKLKADAPDEAVDMLAKTALVPMLEKQMAAGNIHEYEIDEEAVHTEAPGTFYVFYIAANADALDKVSTGLRDTLKANPLIGTAFDAAIDFKDHRDYLNRTNATYK